MYWHEDERRHLQLGGKGGYEGEIEVDEVRQGVLCTCRRG